MVRFCKTVLQYWSAPSSSEYVSLQIFCECLKEGSWQDYIWRRSLNLSPSNFFRLKTATFPFSFETNYRSRFKTKFTADKNQIEWTLMSLNLQWPLKGHWISVTWPDLQILCPTTHPKTWSTTIFWIQFLWILAEPKNEKFYEALMMHFLSCIVWPDVGIKSCPNLT